MPDNIYNSPCISSTCNKIQHITHQGNTGGGKQNAFSEFFSVVNRSLALRTALPSALLEHTHTASLPQDIFSITHKMLFPTETIFRNSCQGPFCLQSRFQRSWVGRGSWMESTWIRSRAADTQPTHDPGSIPLYSPTVEATLLNLLLCRWLVTPNPRQQPLHTPQRQDVITDRKVPVLAPPLPPPLFQKGTHCVLHALPQLLQALQRPCW